MLRRNFFRILFAAFFFTLFFQVEVRAASATHFVGAYKILSGDQKADEYLVIDNGTLQQIWDKYADEPLPASLVPYKEEPTILAGFTNRDFLILAFEVYSTITARFLQMEGGEGEVLEVFKRDDGLNDAATKQAGAIRRYLLAAPVPINLPAKIEIKPLGFQYL